MDTRILLIEDEDSIRGLYEREIKRSGFYIEAYPDGTSGLEGLLKGRFDLILLDIMLPDMNGLQILKKIKTTVQISNIPVVMLTNLGQEVTIKRAFSLGASGYILKVNTQPKDLIRELSKYLQKKQLTVNL